MTVKDHVESFAAGAIGAVAGVGAAVLDDPVEAGIVGVVGSAATFFVALGGSAVFAADSKQLEFKPGSAVAGALSALAAMAFAIYHVAAPARELPAAPTSTAPATTPIAIPAKQPCAIALSAP